MIRIQVGSCYSGKTKNRQPWDRTSDILWRGLWRNSFFVTAERTATTNKRRGRKDSKLRSVTHPAGIFVGHANVATSSTDQLNREELPQRSTSFTDNLYRQFLCSIGNQRELILGKTNSWPIGVATFWPISWFS